MSGPVAYYGNWTIRAFSREVYSTNYLAPNRRDFYKVMLVMKAVGMFTMGMHTYYIEDPTILFIPPAEIISWKGLSDHYMVEICMFKKSFTEAHPLLKTVMDKYRLFTDSGRSVIRLNKTEAGVMLKLFRQMQEAEQTGGEVAEDAMQAYLQLLMIESVKIARYPEPDAVNEDYRHIYRFFDLLDRETANIDARRPVRIKTAREFADDLSLSPNYLNVLLRKHTGQNVSAHIKQRLLDESKALLLQTDWTLQDIGFAVGFSDQPNFSAFFKHLTGITPADFRKANS